MGLGTYQRIRLRYAVRFSDVKKQFFQKRIKGRGYCDVGTSVISEFYTPLVPKGHDFLQTIGCLAQARMKEALSDERIDFAVLYEGIQGSQQDTDTDDKDGFCGSQPQVPFLADGACPVR